MDSETGGDEVLIPRDDHISLAVWSFLVITGTTSAIWFLAPRPIQLLTEYKWLFHLSKVSHRHEANRGHFGRYLPQSSIKQPEVPDGCSDDCWLWLAMPIFCYKRSPSMDPLSNMRWFGIYLITDEVDCSAWKPTVYTSFDCRVNFSESCGVIKK